MDDSTRRQVSDDATFQLHRTRTNINDRNRPPGFLNIGSEQLNQRTDEMRKPPLLDIQKPLVYRLIPFRQQLLYFQEVIGSEPRHLVEDPAKVMGQRAKGLNQFEIGLPGLAMTGCNSGRPSSLKLGEQLSQFILP
jgi:hypothetical protein